MPSFRVEASVDFSVMAKDAEEAERIIDAALSNGDGDALAACISSGLILHVEEES